MASKNKLDDHPTVVKVRQRHDRGVTRRAEPLDASWLRQLCLDAGADAVGFVEIDRPEIADQRADLEAALPGVRVLISFVTRMNRENIRTPSRSVANLEFHHTGDHSNEVGRQVVGKLEAMGVRALNPAMGFPMEMDKFPRKAWVVSHKPVAVAAGLGKMGIHRNVIHPRFGNFVLLGTILIDAEVSEYTRPIEYNPCLECKLCVTACPTGAIASDGHFNFSACYTHNYRSRPLTGRGISVGLRQGTQRGTCRCRPVQPGVPRGQHTPHGRAPDRYTRGRRRAAAAATSGNHPKSAWPF
ncbi:epoxyqueuosine reductase [Streptomyces sp. NPDC020794]|uniref:epoxyqueuosine reductase n=1 Tax=unclassified Streptomyces TaxID=2593676 RepID=UPI0036E1FDDA